MNIEVKISKKKIDYTKAIEILEKRVDEVILGKKPELLWILEHNAIYTGGTSYKNQEILNNKIKIIKTSRGGKITHHGPGQKVVYFVLNLNNRKKDIRSLIYKIENCIIKILRHYKISSFADRKNIGIWYKDKNLDKNHKVAAIGIRVRKWIAYHGFSINIDNDLKPYKNIVPCGIKDGYITNLSNISNKNYQFINKIIIKNFKKLF